MKLRLAIAIAALAGFVALSYEIVWYRVFSMSTGGTAATFGALLAAYLLGLALGSRVSAVWCTDRRSADARGLRTVAAFVAVANAVSMLVAPTFAWTARFASWWWGLSLVAIAAGALGAVLPLVSHFGIEPDERAGPRLSYVYLANIVGSATGSLLTGFVLLDIAPLRVIAGVLAVAGFALAAAAWRASGGRLARVVPAFAGAVLLVLLAVPVLYDRLYERLVYGGEDDGKRRFAQVVENKSGVVTVDTDGTVYGGGAYDGVLNTRLEDNERNGILRAYVAGAIHPAPRETLMIGLSAGAWAQVVVHLPDVEHLTIVEINPAYLEVIATHEEVAGLLRNPKVELVVDDGRRWLTRHPERRFDLIVMNTTLHWRGHVTNLLSAELMELVRHRMRAGGVFYFNTTGSLDAQLTAARLYPHMMRITNFAAVSDAPFRFDRERWKRLLGSMKIEGRPILDVSKPTHQKIYDDLLGFNDMEYGPTILERNEKVARVVTDDNMATEWRDPLRHR